MEATVAKVRDFVRKRIGGQRVWRVGVAMSATTIRVTLLTPDKPERLTEERDKGRAPIIEGLEREIKRAFGREVVIDVVQSPCAVARYIRISPRKCRFVVDAIRNKPVQDALAILQFVPNSAAQTVSKLLKSAVANAENNHRMDAETLEVIHVHVDEGPSLKRISPRAMGRAYRILKRTSHITIGLGETEKAPKVAGRGKGIARTVEKAPRKAAAGRSRAAKESTASAAVSGKGGETETKRRRERGGGK